MTQITVTEKEVNKNNLMYTQSVIAELLTQAGCTLKNTNFGSRTHLLITCPETYLDIVRTELADKIAETVAVNYKYEFFRKNVKVAGLSQTEYEILMASLIAADFEEDKRYTYEKIKDLTDIAVDGIYNFRLQPLKRKWQDIVSYMPSCFINSQLKDFITFLLENKKKRVYIDCGRVYDSHYRRLNRASLLGGSKKVELVKEILLSNCGEVEIYGAIPEEDEFYLKEFYTDKIFFSKRYYS